MSDHVGINQFRKSMKDDYGVGVRTPQREGISANIDESSRVDTREIFLDNKKYISKITRRQMLLDNEIYFGKTTRRLFYGTYVIFYAGGDYELRVKEDRIYNLADEIAVYIE